MAIGQPFVLSSPAKLAAVWFGDNERAIATIIGSLAAPLGAVAGYLLPLPIITDKNTDTEERGRSKFFQYVLIQNIIITALGLPIILFIRNQPPTPPSPSAEKSMKRNVGQIKSMIKLLKNVSVNNSQK